MLVGTHIGSLCYFPVRTWVFLQMGLLLVSLTLVVGGSSADAWIETGDGRNGSLLRCKDCDFRYEWFGYSCLEAIYCSGGAEVCDTFSGLNEAGQFLLQMELIVIVFVLLHLQSSTALLAGRDYGMPILNYVRNYTGVRGTRGDVSVRCSFRVVSNKRSAVWRL